MGRAGNVVPSSFGVDALSAILPTGPTSSGHHCVSVTAVLDRRLDFVSAKLPVGTHRLGNSSALPRVVT
jgi:hypothetical protein